MSIKKVITILFLVEVGATLFLSWAIPWNWHMPWELHKVWLIYFFSISLLSWIIFPFLLRVFLSSSRQLFSLLERKESPSLELFQMASKEVSTFAMKATLLGTLLVELQIVGAVIILSLVVPISLRSLLKMTIFSGILYILGGLFTQFFSLAIVLTNSIHQQLSQEAFKARIEIRGPRMGFLTKIFLPTFSISISALFFASIFGYGVIVDIASRGILRETVAQNRLLAKDIEYKLKAEVDVTELESIVEDTRLDEDRIAFLADAQGEFISFPFSLGEDKRALLFRKRLVEDLKKGRQGSFYYEPLEMAVSYIPVLQGRYIAGAILPLVHEKRLAWVVIPGFLVIAIVAISWVLPLSFFEAKVVTDPVKRIDDTLKELAARRGDLTQRVSISAYDELGDATIDLNYFLETLQKMVIQIRSTADKVSASSQALSSSTQEINASTAEVSGVIAQISKGTTTQAERVEATSKIMKRMADSIRQMVSQAQIGASGSEQAAKRAQEGGEVIEEVVQGMNRISKVVTDSATVVQSLGQRSQEIGEITDTITKLADQTNLLALNAAIEAARAGEAGRGFAVVAEEVRKLAEGSAIAAGKIGNLIKGIQSETQKAITSMETGTSEVNQGRQIVDKAKQAFTEIVKMVQQTAQVATQASVSIGEQLKGTEEVVKSINEIATIAEQSSSAAQEASSSTEEMTASMEEMAASSQELSQMAVELRDLVGRFKLEEETEAAT